MNDDIAITGFSGRFPESSNVEEFKQQLFDEISLITDDGRRWPSDLYDLPTRTGKLKDLTSFDATFFGIHAKQAHVMDPQIRILLELTYEAIVDAGINPSELRGSKTGVFIGGGDSEAAEFWSADSKRRTGYVATGCHTAMFANRISYNFDFIGPSLVINTACSSSLSAVHQAVMAMRSGECDSAIVGSSNLILKPAVSLHFDQLKMLSTDGACKAFDASANGYVRSEAAVVIFLQMSRCTRRIYATVVNSKINAEGYKLQGITFPNGEMQHKLMQEVFSEANIDPSTVVYVEAHGTGTKVGDPIEVNSIAEVFCKNRKKPLLLGAVKSNMGHSELTSGLCSIAKMIIAMEAGVIPGNLHFKNPNPDIPALHDGRIQVVDRFMPWNGGLISINSFGFGGTNAHIILRSNPRQKITSVLHHLPKIVAVSGRTEDSVKIFLAKIKEHEKDDEFISIVQDLNSSPITGHRYRGFQILGDAYVHEVYQFSGEERPIWYVFSGMGSQWSGMGKALLSLDTFQSSLRRCADALTSEGIDLMNLIMSKKNGSFENIVNSFVCIVAIQVALVDLLNLIGIQPDGLIGHSVGEISCAYADGTITPEQAILTAYWRGKSILKSDIPKGSMVVVGLSWEETAKRCPSDVCLACHNGADSVTVSGPSESIAKFVHQLKIDKIFVAEVPCSGIPLHSKYIAPVAPKLRAALEKVIPHPKERTSRWISSSIPEAEWNTPLAKLSSPAYYVNNLVSPVLFHEALGHVPKNAIVIEVAPHCLLQAILRRSLPPEVTNIGLQNRKDSDNLFFFLKSIGKLYVSGGQPQLSKLYPPIAYPVGRGTAMINSMVQWDHSMQWSVPDFSKNLRCSGQNIVEVDVSREADAYFTGHLIDGDNIFPVMGFLVIVWKTFAKRHGKPFETMPIILEDLQFHRSTLIPKEGLLTFEISILQNAGAFEIYESGSCTVTGKIRIPKSIEKEQFYQPTPVDHKELDTLDLNATDLYTDLRLRGYDYHGVFQSIKASDNCIRYGKLAWISNWISFLDSMFQFTILGKNTKELLLLSRLEYVTINPLLHKQLIQNLQPNKDIAVYNDTQIETVKAGGVELRGLKFSSSLRKQSIDNRPKHEKYIFIPYDNSQSLDTRFEKAKFHALCILLQLVKENLVGLKIKAIEVTGERDPQALLTPLTLDILHSEPLVFVDFKLATITPKNYTTVIEQCGIKTVTSLIEKSSIGPDLHLILTANIFDEKMTEALQGFEASLKPGGFILSEENTNINPNMLKRCNLILVSEQSIPGKVYVLLKKEKPHKEEIIIQVTENNFSWVEKLKDAAKKSETEDKQILIFTEGEKQTGVIGLLNCLRQEKGGKGARYVFILDEKAPKFSRYDTLYAQQLNKQLVANVLKGGKWGSYRHIRLNNQSENPGLQVEHAYIDTLKKGDLKSLEWVESPNCYYQTNNFVGQELCHVYYSAVNSRDVMLATAKMSSNAVPDNVNIRHGHLGFEFAGRDLAGRRVMGVVPAGGLATTLLADSQFMWEVPEKWTLEDAATIPLAYAMSYYALMVRGGLKTGESILIHYGSDGIGLASIDIALHACCSVFITVNSTEKRDFLKAMFPQVTDKNIGNSEDTIFEQLVLSETRGRGVDLVMNSFAEENLEPSVRCLAKGGRFLEIGNSGLSNNTLLGTILFMKNVKYEGIFLEALLDSDDLEKKQVTKFVNEGLRSGIIRPLPSIIFTEQQVGQAFNLMATGKNLGKVLIKVREEEFKKITRPTVKTVAAIPRTYMNPVKSYVLVGGLGGLGLEIVNWMIIRGAKYIVLTSRSGIRSGYQALCIRRWREMGIEIKTSTVDITTEAGAKSLLKEASKLAPVGGIFNLAAVFRNALLENVDEDHFRSVTLPKVDVTRNLDKISRIACPELDLFVCFSSVASGRGMPGVTSYGFANSAMERIMEQRQAAGLPGLAIQWGTIGDAGVMVNLVNNKKAEYLGMLLQPMLSVLIDLDLFLKQPDPVLASMVVPQKHISGYSCNQNNILEDVAKILGIADFRSVNLNTRLTEYGMDSLMGTEIKQILEGVYDLILSSEEVLMLTFGKLLKLYSK